MSGRTRHGALFIGFLSGVLLAGCRADPTARSGEEAGTPDNPWVIGMSQADSAEPWRAQMNADLRAAADKHPNLKLVVEDARNRSSTQQDQVRDLIRRGIDLLIISPNEAEPLTRPVNEALDAGIPVIVLDRPIESDRVACFIGADNAQIGRQAGEYLVKLLGGKGRVVELQGLMTSAPGRDRHKGFLEGLQGSQIKIVAAADCEWIDAKARAEMTDILGRVPAIDAVFAHNDPIAYAAYLAAKDEGKGREKTIRFIGIDALDHEGLEYVRQGLLTATLEYPTGGAEAIDVALKILTDRPVPKTIVLAARVFDQDNLEQGGCVIAGR